MDSVSALGSLCVSSKPFIRFLNNRTVCRHMVNIKKEHIFQNLETDTGVSVLLTDVRSGIEVSPSFSELFICSGLSAIKGGVRYLREFFFSFFKFPAELYFLFFQALQYTIKPPRKNRCCTKAEKLPFSYSLGDPEVHCRACHS